VASAKSSHARVDAAPDTPLDLHSAADVGLDLAAVEELQYRIEPTTSALLILAETTWDNELLEVAAATGGFPVVSGCLQPETMLVVGSAVATAAAAGDAATRESAAHGAAMLHALASAADLSSNVTSGVLGALVDAHVIDHLDVNDAIDALTAAGLVPPIAVPHAAHPPDRPGELEES